MKLLRRLFLCMALVIPQVHAAGGAGAPNSSAKPLPTVVELDVHLGDLVALDATDLPKIPPISASILQSAYVDGPKSTGMQLASLRISIPSTTISNGELNNHISSHSCGSSTCGVVRGIPDSGPTIGSFSPGSYNRPRSGSGSIPSRPSTYGSSSGSGSAVDSARRDLESANSDYSSAERDYQNAKSEYNSAYGNLQSEIQSLERKSGELNSAISERNSAASDRDSAAHAANAANQRLHNSRVQNGRIVKDIAAQTTAKANLEQQKVNLTAEVSSRAEGLAAEILGATRPAKASAEKRELNKNTGNKAIADHNRKGNDINQSTNLAKGLATVGNVLGKSAGRSGSHAGSKLPTSPSAGHAYRAPVPVRQGQIPPGLNARPADRVEVQCGSIIHVDSLAAGESIPVAGTMLYLGYMSDRSPYRLADYQVHLPLQNALGPYQKIELELSLAGRTSSETLSGNQQAFDFVWDGRNQNGQMVIGKTFLGAKIKRLTNGSESQEDVKIPIGNFKPNYLGLGGWGINAIHYLNIEESRVYFGDGTSRRVPARRLDNGSYLIPSENGREVYLFNSQGIHLETRQGLTGQRLRWNSYDAEKRLVGIEDGYGNKTVFARDDRGVTIRNPFGIETRLNFDSSGRLISVVDAENHSYTLQYSDAGLLSAFTKPAGQTTNFSYDEFGYLVKDQGAAGNALIFAAIRDAANPKAVVIKMSTATGRHFTHRVARDDNGDYIMLKEDPSGQSSRNEYKPGEYEREIGQDEDVYTQFGRDVRFGDAVHFTTRTRYAINDLPDRTLEIQSEQRVTGFERAKDFADFQQLKIRVRQNARVSNVVYDQDRRESINSSAAGRITRTIMMPSGQPRSIQVGELAPTTWSYDHFGRVTSVAQGSRRTRYEYDERGLVSRAINPVGQSFNYKYDKVGRALSKTDPSGNTVEMRYDANSNLTGILPAKKQQHNFIYNLLELLERYLPPALSWSDKQKETRYEYDLDRKMTKIFMPSRDVVQFTYGDKDGLLKSVSAPDGTYAYAYTAKARLENLTSPDGVQLAFRTFGPLPAQEKMTLGTGLVTALNFDYSKNLEVSTLHLTVIGDKVGIPYDYDADGLLVRAGELTAQRDAQHGKVIAAQLKNLKESYGYDKQFGELTNFEAKVGTELIYGQSYKRDDLGRVAKVTEAYGSNAQVFQYAYDPVGRLIEVKKNDQTISRYTYDSNGNRNGGVADNVVIKASYSAQDQLEEYNNLSFTYDDNGNLSERRDNSKSHSTKFRYDVFGNLKAVELPDGKQIKYIVDGLNRRVGKIVNGQSAEYYVYQSQLQIAAVLNTEGRLISRFVYGMKTNVPDYMIRDGHTYKIVSDHLGSPRVVVDVESGEIAQTIVYDEFGRVISDSNPGFQPFGFAGGLMDSDTKLVRFGARDYDPETGRWTSKDPIRFKGGDTNLYGYVFNDPVNFNDPMGLWSISASAYLKVGGGISVGQNPDGSWFGTVRMGVGLGGGASWDKLGKSPDYYKGMPCRGTSVGVFAEGGGHLGPIEVSATSNSGRRQDGSSYANPMDFSAVVTPSIAVEAGVSTGLELTFHSNRLF